MIRSHDQDRAIAGVVHDVFHQPTDREASVPLWEGDAHYEQIKFSLLDLVDDLILRAADPDLALRGNAEHFQAIHAAGNEPFHALALVFIFQLASQDCE